MAEELVVYVEPDGTPTGETSPKLEAHTDSTRLHLAFSCYVFNDEGLILATQRAMTKKVWPGVWTNSVCGHPGPGENITDAITRRLAFELGIQAVDIRLALPKYTYKTPPFRGIIEHEFCPVYVARAKGLPRPNPEEVDDCVWMTWESFVSDALSDSDNSWAWWCKDQTKLLNDLPVIAQYNKPR